MSCVTPVGTALLKHDALVPLGAGTLLGINITGSQAGLELPWGGLGRAVPSGLQGQGWDAWAGTFLGSRDVRGGMAAGMPRKAAGGS